MDTENLLNLEVKRYGHRHWAVYRDGDLLAVTVYRKGARCVVDTIHELAEPDFV